MSRTGLVNVNTGNMLQQGIWRTGITGHQQAISLGSSFHLRVYIRMMKVVHVWSYPGESDELLCGVIWASGFLNDPQAMLNLGEAENH